MENQNTDDRNKKIKKIEYLINDVLKNDLKYVWDQKNIIQKKVTDHMQLKNMIENIKDSLPSGEPVKTMSDLGCNFYVKTVVPDPSTIYVNVGFNLYVQFTLDEAVQFLDKKLEYLEGLAKYHSTQATKIKAEIKMAYEDCSSVKARIGENRPGTLKLYHDGTIIMDKTIQGLREAQMIDQLTDEPEHRDIF